MEAAWLNAKTADELSMALPRIEHGTLTGAELAVAYAVLKGLSGVQAGEEIFRTEKLVKYHLTNIYSKCKVKSRAEFIVKYLPGFVADKFIGKIEEKEKRIQCLEMIIDNLRKELMRQNLPRGLST